MSRAPPYTLPSAPQGFIQMVDTEDDDGASTSGSSTSSFSRTSLLAQLSTAFKRSGTVSLALDAPLVYVNPTPSPTSPPPSLSGTVVLAPHEGRTFDSLIVTMQGSCSLNFPDGRSESYTLMTRKAQAKPNRSDARQAFRFRFEIPGDAAPSASAPWGQVVWSVNVEAKGEKVWGEVTAERPFRVVAMPAGDSLDSMSLQYSLDTHSEELGPYQISLTASPLTVSGLVATNLRLVDVPSNLTIHAINHYLLTTPTLRSLSHRDADGRPSATSCPPTKIKLSVHEATGKPALRRCRGDRGVCEVEDRELEMPLNVPKQSGSWDMSQTIKLPSHDRILPSTAPQSLTPIVISHSLIIDVVFSTDPATPIATSNDPPSPPPRRVLSITKPVTIASCLCTPDAVLLPAYHASDPHLEERVKTVALGEGDPAPAPARAARDLREETAWCACSASTASFAPLCPANRDSGGDSQDLSMLVKKLSA